LKVFLEKSAHPVVERWKAVTAEAAAEVKEEVEVEAPSEIPLSEVPLTAGGFKIILKDAKIRAKKIIIRRVEK
jgi:CO dehydrogenase/acetyl-CoA synthase beta subunit